MAVFGNPNHLIKTNLSSGILNIVENEADQKIIDLQSNVDSNQNLERLKS